VPSVFARSAPTGRRGIGLHGGPLGADLAKTLGTTPEKLREALHSGTSLADLAKAHGKSVAEVRAALKSAARARLEKAVEDGDLAREQADRILDRVERHVDALAAGRSLRMPRHGHRPMPGGRAEPAPPGTFG